MIQSLKGKRLLLLGSNVWRDVIRRFANEYEVTLIFAGKYPALLDDIADEVYRVDSINHEAMKRFICEHNIDGVYMGGSELIISHACQYLNELGLPCYCTYDQWETLQNKAKFKELCIKNGLPVVPRYILDSEDVRGSVPEDAYPVITKPADGSGSNGFSVCHNADELEKGYQIAAENSFTGEVMCEKFVRNEGIVAFFSFSNGNMTFTLAEDKFPVRYEKQGSYVAGLFLCESCHTQEFRQKYEKKVAAMFREIGIKEGTIWIEIFHDGDQYFFNEVGYRYGGSFSFYTVDYFRSINQVYADIYYALTGESKLYGFSTLMPEKVKHGLNYCIYPIHLKPGKIVKIDGLEEIERWPNVVLIPKQKEEGDKVADSGSFGQVMALAHFTFKDNAECERTINRIHEVLKVTDSEGNEMVNKMFNLKTVFE